MYKVPSEVQFGSEHEFPLHHYSIGVQRSILEKYQVASIKYQGFVPACGRQAKCQVPCLPTGRQVPSEVQFESAHESNFFLHHPEFDIRH